MTMKASERQVSGITIIDLSGKITLGEDDPVSERSRNGNGDGTTRGI